MNDMSRFDFQPFMIIALACSLAPKARCYDSQERGSCPIIRARAQPAPTASLTTAAVLFDLRIQRLDLLLQYRMR